MATVSLWAVPSTSFLLSSAFLLAKIQRTVVLLGIDLDRVLEAGSFCFFCCCITSGYGHQRTQFGRYTDPICSSHCRCRRKPRISWLSIRCRCCRSSSRSCISRGSSDHLIFYCNSHFSLPQARFPVLYPESRLLSVVVRWEGLYSFSSSLLSLVCFQSDFSYAFTCPFEC